MLFGLGLAVFGGCRFCHSDTGSGFNWTVKMISSGMFCHSGDNVLYFRTIPPQTVDVSFRVRHGEGHDMACASTGNIKRFEQHTDH